MKFHQTPHFSASRQSPVTDKQSRERQDSFMLFGLLPNFMIVDDIAFVEPDPPDMVILSERRRVGLELTRVFPGSAAGSRKGYAHAGRHSRWLEDAKIRQPAHEEFAWPEHSIGDLLTGVQVALRAKAEQVGRYAADYDEAWLCLCCGPGSGMSVFPGDPARLKASHDELGRQVLGKFLLEMKRLCPEALPFAKVILLGERLVSFPLLDSPFCLPEPDSELLAIGAQASDEILTWIKHSTSSVRHWRPESGQSLGDFLKGSP